MGNKAKINLWKSFIHKSADAIYIEESANHSIYINMAFEAMFGWRKNEVCNILDFIVKEQKTEFQSLLHQVWVGHAVQGHETLAYRKNGEIIHISMSVSPLFDDQDQLFGVIYTIRNITSRKLAEFELLEREREAKKALKTIKDQLESYIQQSADGIFIFTNDGIILKANSAIEKIYGWSKNELIGNHYVSYHIPPEYKDEAISLHQRVITNKQMINYDAIRQRKDRQKIHVNTTLSPIFDFDGNIVAVSAIIREITEKKQAEEKLQRLKEELQKTVRQQQGIIFKLEKNTCGRIIYTLCDGELLYQLGLSPQAVVGRDAMEIFPRPIGSFINRYHEQAWIGEEVNFEVEINGFSILVALKPLMDDNEITEVIGSCVNITQLKLTEELLRKSEKLAVIGQLAAGIAHEIRNPLTTIKGFIHLFREKLHHQDHLFIELMLSEINRIEWITCEFMVISKPSAKNYKVLNLEQVLNHVINFITPQTLLSNIQIFTDLQNALAYIIGEENHLKQFFLNIIKNSIEAMPNGGSITITTKVNDDRLIIKITDQGCGIPQDRIARLGEPFYSLKEKGTGLGLMICYKIIEEHNGSLRLESEIGKGTTVEVVLPVHHSDCEVS